MARKPRDYAKEYTDRVSKHRAEGHDLTRARGHGTKEHERGQRLEAKYRRKQGISGPSLLGRAKLQMWAGRTVPPDMDPEEWERVLNASVENHGGKDEDRLALANKLQHKWELTQAYNRELKKGKSPLQAAEDSGAAAWWNDRDDYDPVEIYWYRD